MKEIFVIRNTDMKYYQGSGAFGKYDTCHKYENYKVAKERLNLIFQITKQKLALTIDKIHIVEE